MSLSIFITSPFSLARYQIAALYLALIFLSLKIFEKTFIFQIGLLGGLFFVFPFLDRFRSFNYENFNFKFNFNYLNKAHFDSYQNFTKVVELNLITYGEQLKGALLFFIPRSIWNEKPVGSGKLLSDLNNYENWNISMPFIAEGYINFGILGSMSFMFILGILLSNFDRIIWKLKRLNQNNLIIILYYLFFGNIFYLMRGDLMTSISYIFSITILFFIITSVLRIAERATFK